MERGGGTQRELALVQCSCNSPQDPWCWGVRLADCRAQWGPGGGFLCSCACTLTAFSPQVRALGTFRQGWWCTLLFLEAFPVGFLVPLLHALLLSFFFPQFKGQKDSLDHLICLSVKHDPSLWLLSLTARAVHDRSDLPREIWFSSPTGWVGLLWMCLETGIAFTWGTGRKWEWCSHFKSFSPI